MATKEVTRYIEGIGRRKTSTARVRITPSTKQQVLVNEKPVEEYFPTETLRANTIAPLRTGGLEQKFTVTVHVSGGGIVSQSDAVRHGLARALTRFEITLRKALKAAGYLTRDPRMVERKKFGMRKARRAPQWSKR